METIALGLVQESIESLLKATAVRINEEILLVWGLKANLKDLQKELIKVNWLLIGAESKFGAELPESENPIFKEWVKGVAKVAYRAEDVIDEYAYKVLKCKSNLADMAEMKSLVFRLKTKVQLFSCFSKDGPVGFRLRMAHDLKSLRESVAEIYANARDLGINPLHVATAAGAGADDYRAILGAERQLQLRRENVDDEGLIERDHFMHQIKQQLRLASNSNKRLNVIGVFGMAGCGKTTISRIIFKGTEVKEHFEEHIWICVSHDFDFTRLLKGMLEQLGERSTISDSEAIKKSLQEKLQRKKFFLVLDDVWDTFPAVWEPFRSCLQNMSELKGNLILVTSRSKEALANLRAYSADPLQPIDDPCIHELARLTEEDSWSLFKQRVGDNLFDSTKAQLAKKFLETCDGVPLAIRTLADLLRSREIHVWKEIEASGIWNDKDNIVLPSIKLSFKYLPSVVLKKCFVYCAIFPEDEVIEKDRLIQLWMAQGFLQHPHDEMERVGEEYFHVLLNNSLFQDAEFDGLGDVNCCKMHDVVHALARSLSSNEVTQQVHHLSLLHHGQLGSMSELGDKYLRTLFLSVNPFTSDNFSNNAIKYLRALSLIDVWIVGMPDSIGELKHLRYLHISRINGLPDGLAKLYNLQTLRLASYGSFISVLKFPNGFSKLINLRHICMNDKMGIPMGLGMLTCLRTLPIIDASANWGGRLSELHSLSRLEGRLRIDDFQCVGVEEAKKVELGTKENIKELILISAVGKFITHDLVRNEKMVVQALQPHPNLASLTIERYHGEQLPLWVKAMTGYGGSPLSNLAYLQISDCFTLAELPTSLNNLVALKALRFSTCRNVKSFPSHLGCLTSLQMLTVTHCPKMKNIVADITPLVNLRVVYITGCRNMTCLPTGIPNLPRLEELEIGAFSPELDVFPFPVTNTDCDYEDDILPGPSNLNGKNEIITSGRFKSLVKLELVGTGMDQIKNLPKPIQYLHQLRHLGISSFPALEALPEWLSNLTALLVLELNFLLNLKCLPSLAAVGHLTELKIFDCPWLKEACARNTGVEWPKVRHIPNVTIDYSRLTDYIPEKDMLLGRPGSVI